MYFFVGTARLELAASNAHGTRPLSLRKHEVELWIKAEESRLASEVEARREAREDAMLASSKTSVRWAMYAAIAAVIAIAIANIDQIIGLIAGTPFP